MRKKEAIHIEEERFKDFDINDVQDYPWFHERHRIFPAVFENRGHKRILDIAAGMGIVGKRILDAYPAELLCNDITPACLNVMKKFGIPTVSFDIDDCEKAFPFPDGHFDAIIALATIEHLMNVDYFMQEVHRMLCNDSGYLYISIPNYSGLLYLLPFIISGKTFHDPMSKSGTDRYEFYAHVKYFTHNTLLEFVSFFGFTPDTVYLAKPESATKYMALKAKSKLKALGYRSFMKFMYRCFSPRWASEPVICFRKSTVAGNATLRKVVL
jgi:2-polyprenyl-3-methyl-5-hydroxy-6-metoxy-1,4-benzoquinol methylase